MSAAAADPMADAGFRLLAACAHWPLDEVRLDTIRAAAAELGDGLPGFAAMARRHRMILLAARGLVEAGVPCPPALLRQQHQRAMQAMQTVAETLRLLRMLDTAGVQAVVLKGPVLSQQLFGDATLRESKDIDLLVDWARFTDAARLLERDGYAIVGEVPPFDTPSMALWGRAAKDLTLAKGKNGRPTMQVELHHRLRTARALLPELGQQQATHTVMLAGHPCAAFGEGDLFAYLCAHGPTTLWHRLKWLADVQALLSGQSAGQIDALVAHAASLGIDRCAQLAVLLCDHVWPLPLSDALRASSTTDRKLASLLRQSLAALANEDALDASVGTNVTMATFMLRDDFAYRLSMAETALIDADHIARWRLPRLLYPLYFLLRAGDWLMRGKRGKLA